jgi:hypothetical protein
VYTGSLTLKTNPKTVSIKLDGKEPRSRLVNVINDSYFITGLRPGQHKITLTAKEFKPWTKNINIHSGISTELWNILLLRQNYDRIKFDIADIAKFFPAPKENLYATTSQLGKTLIIHIFDIKTNTSTNSFIFPQTTFTNDIYENIEWSPDSKSLIMPILQNTNSNSIKAYAIASANNSEFLLLSDLTQEDSPQFVRWDPEEKNVIYFLSNTILYRLNIDILNKTSEQNIVSNNVLAYDFADDGLYLLQTDGTITYGGDKKEASDMKKLTNFNIDPTNTNYRLISYDNHRVLLIDDNNGNLFLYNKGDKNIYTKKLGSNIIGAHFSDDGKKLLFYSPFEIFIYFTRDLESQPLRFENQLQSIVRFSRELTNVHFAKNYEHIIYTVGNEIKITELDYRGDIITETITKLHESNTTLINKHKMNKLLFIDTTEQRDRQLQLINFPEKETLF